VALTRWLSPVDDPRRDEDQLSARFEVAQAFFNEEQVEVGALVEHAVAGLPPRFGRDVLVANVGRIADNRGEQLIVRKFKEVHHQGSRWRMTGVDLDPLRARKMPQKSAVAAGRLEHAAALAHQRAHAVDDRRWREYLAEGGDVAGRRSGREVSHFEGRAGGEGDEYTLESQDAKAVLASAGALRYLRRTPREERIIDACGVACFRQKQEKP